VSSLQAASLSAAYIFNNTLNAVEGGVPALVAANPLGTNAYSTTTLYGATRSVYSFNSSPGNNAGLTFNDNTSLIAPGSYSIEMAFSLNSLTNSIGTGWLRLVDSQNRQSDSGLYVNPSAVYTIYPDSPVSTTTFSPNTYYDLILTDDGTTANLYINGTLALSDNLDGTGTNQMNLNNANNPSQLLNLFLDNTAAGGQGEFVSGNIALFEAFNGVLSPTDAANLAANPYANVPTSTTPEPATWLLLAPAAGLAFRKVRKAR
jgi:hypothetical protein